MQAITLTVLTAATVFDTVEVWKPPTNIPNAVFLPALILPVLNFKALPLLLASTGFLAARKKLIGFSDILAYTTILFTGPEALLMSLAGTILTNKTIYRKKNQHPGMPGILIGYTAYLLLAS